MSCLTFYPVKAHLRDEDEMLCGAETAVNNATNDDLLLVGKILVLTPAAWPCIVDISFCTLLSVHPIDM